MSNDEDLYFTFELGDNDNINAEFELEENDSIDCLFEINAINPAWGSISGTLSNQEDLQAALDLKADKSELESDMAAVDEAISNVQTVVENNYNTLDGKIDTINSALSGDISTLENTVNSNNTAVNNRIDTTNQTVAELSTTVADNNTAINSRVDGIVETFDGDISNLETAIQNEVTTRANNDTLLQGDINTLRNDLTSEISNRTSADDTLQDNIDTLASDLSDEVAARENADSIIGDSITALDNKYDSVTGALDDKIDSINGALSDSITALDSVVSSNYTTLDDKIDSVNGALSDSISGVDTKFDSITGALSDSITGLDTKYDSITGALDTKIDNHIGDTLNPHSVTKAQVGLGNCDNTSDANKPISTATQNALDSISGALSDSITALDSVVSGNFTTLSDSITALDSVVSSNYTTLDDKIDSVNGALSDSISAIDNTINGYGNIVTHNVSEFATAAQGLLADSALQPNDNISELNNDAGYITSINQADVIDALGYTPYNATNPSGYQANVIESIKVNNTTQTVVNKAVNITVPTTAAEVGALPDTTTINDLTTAAQQAALNSGATTSNIGQIATNTGNINSLSDTVTNNYNTLDGKITSEVNTLNGAITGEATNRQNADNALQTQIDAITSASDVFDIVGTYAELQAYDITTVPVNDIIKVLVDSTHNNAATYYRCVENNNVKSWSYIGAEGAYYTKSEADNKFVEQTITVNGQPLSSNVTLTASDVGALPSSTTIGAGVLTIQKNGSNVDTFSANATSNKTINITVPTDTNDLTNGAGFITASAIGNGTVTINQGGTQKGTFTLNQSGNVTIDLDAGGGTPTNMVTTDTAQDISGRKTFLGEKAIYFKQQATSNKLGFTLYNPSNTELAALEYRPNTISGASLLALNCPQTTGGYVGFRYWGSPAVNIVAPKVATAGNYFMATHITNGTLTVTANNQGSVDISSLLPDVSNFVTNTSLATTLADYALSADIPTKTSDLTNDSNFATVSQIPTNNNQLTNGAGYITNSALTPYVLSSSLATVATSGSYNDLDDKPTIPAAQVNADWNATSGVAQILNKPTIPTVGNGTVTLNQGGTQKGTFTLNQSGNTTINLDGLSYVAGTGIEIDTSSIPIISIDSTVVATKNELTDFVTISELNNEILPNYARYNEIPTATSDLTNDSGYITNSALTGYATQTWVGQQGYLTNSDLTDYITESTLFAALEHYQTVLISGENIKTINNTSLLGSGNIVVANTDLSNLSATGQAVIDGKVSKSGDTMTGALILENDCVIQREGAIKGTSPSENIYWSLGFCDSQGTAVANRIGTIESSYTSSGATRTDILVYEPTNGSRDNARIRLGYTSNKVAYCEFPNTTCVDGQWVKDNLTIASNVTWKTNTAVKTYSLSSYLPDDGYSYEVLFCGVAVTGTTSGNFVAVRLSTDLMNYTTVCEARTRQSASFEAQGSVILPVGTDRWVRQYSSDSGNANGTYTLQAVGYRRIGTNS